MDTTEFSNNPVNESVNNSTNTPTNTSQIINFDDMTTLFDIVCYLMQYREEHNCLEKL